MSANEVRWPHLSNILHRIRHNQQDDVAQPPLEFTAAYRAYLVNEDPVICVIYFEKLIRCLLNILQSQTHSLFGDNYVEDYFMRIEFQHRGSPHAHLLVWLKDAPHEEISEHMPLTVDLINRLCTVDYKNVIEDQSYASCQVHEHTFTCNKNLKRVL